MQTNYTLSEIKDIEELAESLSKYHPTQTVAESHDILKKHFVFGYKGQNDVAKGFVYALNVDNTYIIDGCNDGIGLFFAIIAAKNVRNELFEKYTDTIFCAYPSTETHSQIICKRIGFKELTKKDDMTIFFLNKE
jgi:hypothetical protein